MRFLRNIFCLLSGTKLYWRSTSASCATTFYYRWFLMLNFLLFVLRPLSFFSLLLLWHSPASSQTTSRPYRFNNLNFNWNLPFIILRFCFLRLIIFNFFSWFSLILILICRISIVYSLLSWIIWCIVLL